MSRQNFDKVLNSFSFDPVTEFSFKNEVQPKIEEDIPSFISVEFETRKEVPAETLVNLPDKEEEVTEPKITTLPDKYSGLKDFYQAVNDSYIKSDDAKYALLAQMGLESGWGKRSEGSKYFNYGNITTGSSWKGDYFKGGDTNAAGEKITQKFRKYKNAEGFFNDYINLIKNLYPEAHEQLISEDFDIDKFSYGLRHGRAGMYAESPDYEDSLRLVFNSVKNSMSPTKTITRKKGGILYNY